MKHLRAATVMVSLCALLGFAVPPRSPGQSADAPVSDPATAGIPCTAVYAQDFSSDPGWITDDPLHLARHAGSSTFHGTQTNRDGSYAYVELPAFEPNASWRLEWDHLISACDRSAALDVGLFDSRLSYPQGAGLEVGVTDSGHGLALAGNGATTATAYSPVWAEGVWYHNVMEYDAAGQQLTLTVTVRPSGFPFQTLSLPVASFPAGMTRLGVSRVPVKGLTNGVNPAARVEFNLDNIRLCQTLANRAPVALCRDTNVIAGAACNAPASVDAGSFDPDGDVFTVTQSPPGPYPVGTTVVTLTVTDAQGASSSCTGRVTVVDGTPPAITCPADMAVEGETEAGAVVTFTAAAADACSDPTIVCTPPSGSLFPIGKTTVVCLATDPAGNAASCGFEVTVLSDAGAREVMEGVLADLQALLAGATTAVDQRNLEQAIERLTRSLDPELWVDSNHLAWKEGDKVFNEVKDAVNRLEVLLRSPQSALEAEALLGLIDQLLEADRSLAEISLQDAAEAQATPESLAPARKAMQAGDAAAASGKHTVAILLYRNAWKFTGQITADWE